MILAGALSHDPISLLISQRPSRACCPWEQPLGTLRRLTDFGPPGNTFSGGTSVHNNSAFWPVVNFFFLEGIWNFQTTIFSQILHNQLWIDSRRQNSTKNSKQLNSCFSRIQSALSGTAVLPTDRTTSPWQEPSTLPTRQSWYDFGTHFIHTGTSVGSEKGTRLR